MIYCAIMGFGVVGSGVAEVLLKNRESIAKKAGDELKIKYILDLRDFPGHELEECFTKDFEKIINDPEVSIVVETMGGTKPAYDYTKRLLLAGKNVVTSNKELVATYGAELLKIAVEGNLNYLFEASVGGGIPIIRPLNQCLAANEIEEIIGILNGTTNYILTKMIKEQKSFDEALSEAKENGYAEKNPAADIEGIDACRKIAILSSLVFGSHVDPNEIPTEGITKVDLKDVEFAEADGKVIKLLGRCRHLENGKIFAMVSPCLIPSDHPLATVDDVYNGILVRGDATGDVMFYGKGAGKLPTASAVVADMIDVAKHFKKRKNLLWKDNGKHIVSDYKKEECSYFIRILSPDKDLALKEADRLFGRVKDIELPKYDSELAFITPKAEEGKLLLALEEYKKIEEITVQSVIRSIEG